VVKCRPTLDLAATIIDASNPLEEAVFHFDGDDLFSPWARRRGLPLGNQTSQFFANVYLNPLDRTADGVTFLGWRVFPDHTRLVSGNVVRFRRRLREVRTAYGTGRVEWRDVDSRVRAWIAHAAHGSTWKLRGQLFGQAAFRKGRSI
jgi:hypothetical protein